MSEANELLAQTLDLNGLLDYQAGAVVSRTIIKKEAGNVTLFAFDKGEGLSEHTAPFDALVQVTDGEALITLSGEEHKVSAGQFIIMPADQPHALKALTPYKMLLVMIKAPAN